MSSTSLTRPVQPATPGRLVQSSAAPATPATPATPAATPQPGTWAHPRMDEIARRQNASVFNGENINRIVLNGVALLASFYAPEVLYHYTPSAAFNHLKEFQPYPTVFLLLCRLFLLFNIAVACSPLLKAKDEITDIPLTPSQRALLGLRPAATTPGQQYITPPRYARSATPKSSSSAQRFSTGTPSSLDRSTAGYNRPASPSPYSPSPLMQKALNSSTSKRLSFNSSSPLDIPGFGASHGGDGSGSLGSTPPSIGLASGRASVGLNSKWLYERGRASPNGKALFT